MAISSLVVTLDRDPDLAHLAIKRLGEVPGITLGAPHHWRVPVVLESDSLRTGRDTVERLQALPGIALIDVVSIDFDELDTTTWNDDNF